ncbi:putative glycoprotein [Hubei diptera virus 5]|uniref:Envelopment polyprotein n=1 Tax=Hubei diptera virus 5 TaxID=1922886 RepID=A0A1L3KPK7_9VIRU|nr:putative glycoprotein [Hubei diptera virus 5]APG79289.1 putative glycoprotein [Hubei diptera virus 5]
MAKPLYFRILIILVCRVLLLFAVANNTSFGDGSKILNIIQGGNFQTLNNHGGFHVKTESDKINCPVCNCNNTELVNVIKTFFESNNSSFKTLNITNRATELTSNYTLIKMIPPSTSGNNDDNPKAEVELLSNTLNNQNQGSFIPPIMSFLVNRIVHEEPIEMKVLRYQDKIGQISEQIKDIIFEDTSIVCDTKSLKKMLLCVSTYIGEDQDKNIKVLSMLLNLISDFLSEFKLRNKNNNYDGNVKLGKFSHLMDQNDKSNAISSFGRKLLSVNKDVLFTSEVEPGTSIMRSKPDEYDISVRLSRIMEGPKTSNIDAVKAFEIFRVHCDRKHNDVNRLDEIELSAIVKPHFSTTTQVCFSTFLCPTDYHFDFTTRECKQSLDGALLNDEFDFKSIKLSSIVGRVTSHPFETIIPRLKKNYCKIDNHSIRKCVGKIKKFEKDFMAIHVANDWVLVDGDYLLTMVQDSKDFRSYVCNSSNPLIIPDTDCRGDDSFIRAFGRGNSDCFCRINNNWHDLVFKNLDGVSYIDAWIAFTWTVEIDSKVIENLNCDDCEFKCKNGIIDYSVKKYISLMKICFMDHCILRDIKQMSGSIRIPELRFYGSKFKITLLSETKTGEFITEVDCSNIDLCQSISCVFCLERLANYHCLSSYLLILYVLILFATFLILSIIYKIMKLLKAIFMSLFVTLKFSYKLVRYICIKFYRYCRGHMSRSYNRVVELDDQDLWETPRQDEESMEDVRIDDHSPMNRTPMRRPRVLPANRTSRDIKMSLFIVATIITLAFSCSDIGSISTQDVSCTEYKNTISCVTDFNIMLTVAPMGQYACIQAKSIEGRVIMSIRIKTKSIKLICNKRSLYYTYRTTPTISKVYRCDSAGECSKNVCNSNDPKIFEKELNPNELKVLGNTGCKSVNGFWGNGCFYASSACIFYRVLFPNVENGDFYEMFDCPHWSWQIELEITQSDLIQEKVSSVVLSNELPTQSSIGSIRLHSVSVPPSPVLSDCFMSSSIAGMNFISLTNCNKKDQLIKGELGEIQCPSGVDAGNATNKCSYSSSIYSVTASGNDIQFASEVINPKDTSKAKRLPLNFDGFMLDIDNSIPIARMFGSSLFQFSIATSKYKFEILKERSSCSTTFLNLTGCYNCLGGATLCLKVDVDKESSILKVDCPKSKISTVFMVNKNSREYCSKLSSNVQTIHEECEIVCSGNTEKVKLEASLSYDVNVIHKDNTNYIYNGVGILRGVDISTISLWSLGFIILGFLIFLIIILLIKKCLFDHKTLKAFDPSSKSI